MKRVHVNALDTDIRQCLGLACLSLRYDDISANVSFVSQRQVSYCMLVISFSMYIFVLVCI